MTKAGRVEASAVMTSFRAGQVPIAIRIEVKTGPLETSADPLADGGRVLADAAGKHHRLRTAHGAEKSANVFPHAVTEYIDGSADAVILVKGDFVLENAHIVGQPGDAEQTGLGVDIASTYPRESPSLVEIRFTMTG